jgi:hypothetical protein
LLRQRSRPRMLSRRMAASSQSSKISAWRSWLSESSTGLLRAYHCQIFYTAVPYQVSIAGRTGGRPRRGAVSDSLDEESRNAIPPLGGANQGDVTQRTLCQKEATSTNTCQAARRTAIFAQRASGRGRGPWTADGMPSLVVRCDSDICPVTMAALRVQSAAAGKSCRSVEGGLSRWFGTSRTGLHVQEG